MNEENMWNKNRESEETANVPDGKNWFLSSHWVFQCIKRQAGRFRIYGLTTFNIRITFVTDDISMIGTRFFHFIMSVFSFFTGAQKFIEPNTCASTLTENKN